MSTQDRRRGLSRALLATLTALAAFSIMPRASAQGTWADLRYQYRVPFSISNPTSHDFAAGDLVTASLSAVVPAGTVRPDGSDFVVYQGSTAIAARGIEMGGTIKAIFALPSALAAGGAQTGYTLYFGGPSSPGATPAGVQVFAFNDGQAHGWKATHESGSVSPGIVDPLTNAPTLRLNTRGSDWYGWNAAFIGTDMTPTSETTLYTQYHVTAANQGNCPIVRANFAPGTDPVQWAGPSGPGIFYGWGKYVYTVDRGAHNGGDGYNYQDFGDITANYSSDPTKLQCAVVSSWDASDGTWIGGKAWNVTPGASPEPDPSPGQFGSQANVSTAGTPPADPPTTGVVMFDFNAGASYPGDGSPVYLYYVVAAASGYCETIGTTASAIETATVPTGKAVVQGVAYDASVGKTAPVSGIAVTVKDGSGATVTTYTTDSTGRYRFVVNAGPTAQTFTLLGQATAKSGTASQSVVEANTYNVDLPIAFGARAKGTVVDATTFGPINAATVTILQPGTSTVVATTTTAADGTYQIDLPAGGTYDVSAAAGSYTSKVQAGVSMTPGAVTTTNFTLTAPELAPNGGFEQSEAAPDPSAPGTTKPVAWEDLSLPDTVGAYPALNLAISNSLTTLNDTSDQTYAFFYLNDASMAHGGTHSLAVKRTAGYGTGDNGWQLSTGSLIPVTAGQRYRVTGWAKATAGAHIVARVRFASTNDAAASDLGNDSWISAMGLITGWQKLTGIISAPSGKSFMQVILYNRYNAGGTAHNPQFTEPSVVAWDDVSVQAVSRRPVTGTVTDDAGNPVSGVRVGFAATRPGMENSDFGAVTASNGTFTINLTDPGTFNVQTWRDGWMARAQPTLDATGATVAPLSLKAPNVPAYNAAVGSDAETADALGNDATTVVWTSDAYAFDGFDAVRTGNNGDGGWAGWSQWGSNDLKLEQFPVSFTGDMHRAVTFSQVTLAFNWRTAPYFDVQTSMDKATWNTVYSANGWGMQTIAAGDLNPVVIPLASPVTARYIRLVIRDAYRDEGSGNKSFSFWEVKVEQPAGAVTGQVISSKGAAVAGAVVGTQFPSGYYYATTDATGAYTINTPAGVPTNLYAHMTTTPDKVLPLSDPVSVTSSLTAKTTADPIVLGDPQTNLVPAGTVTASSGAGGADGSGNESPKSVDKDYTTMWNYTAYLSDANPAYLDLDFGSAQTFNQFQIMWEWGYPTHFSVSTSSDGTNYTPIHTSLSCNAGYSFASGKFMYPVRLAQAVTARYVRIECGWKQTQWTGIWEFAIANVPANPPVPFALTKKAMKVWAGFQTLQSGDLATLDTNNDKAVNMVDVDTLAKQQK